MWTYRTCSASISFSDMSVWRQHCSNLPWSCLIAGHKKDFWARRESLVCSVHIQPCCVDIPARRLVCSVFVLWWWDLWDYLWTTGGTCGQSLSRRIQLFQSSRWRKSFSPQKLNVFWSRSYESWCFIFNHVQSGLSALVVFALWIQEWDRKIWCLAFNGCVTHDVRYETVKIQKQSNIKEKFNVFTHVYLVFCHVF